MSILLSDKKINQIGDHIQKNYIDSGKFPGALVGFYHLGDITFLNPLGMMDVERSKPMKKDSIFRIYSMTKPITSVALMQLCEAKSINLDDPVYKYIESWKNLKVYNSGDLGNFVVDFPSRHMTIKDLMTHQSGLSYGYISNTKVTRSMI